MFILIFFFYNAIFIPFELKQLKGMKYFYLKNIVFNYKFLF